MQSRSFAKLVSIVGGIIVLGIALWVRTQSPPGDGPFSPSPRDSQPAGSYDLGRDEKLGGHTLQRHVGRTDEQLLERLRREPEISAASTYQDRATAEKTVGAALAEQKNRIESWLDRSDSHPNLPLRFRGRDPIGRSIRRGEYSSKPCYDATIVLRWDGNRRFHVLTSYPEPRYDR